MNIIVALIYHSACNFDDLVWCRSVPVSCGDPGIPDNAVRQGDSFLYQDEVTFTCNDGYFQSSGPEGGVRMCLDTGLWSDTQPECSRERVE